MDNDPVLILIINYVEATWEAGSSHPSSPWLITWLIIDKAIIHDKALLTMLKYLAIFSCSLPWVTYNCPY